MLSACVLAISPTQKKLHERKLIHTVTWVQFPKWQSIVAVEVGMANLQTKYQILFTPTGEIIRARNVTYIYNPLGAATFL